MVSFSAFHHFDGGLNSMTFHLEHNVANFILIPHNLCSFCKNALFALLYVYVSVYIRITRREFALFSHISVKVKTASCTIPGFLSQLYKLEGIFHVWIRTVIWIVGLWGIEDNHASSAKLWIKLGKTTKKDFLLKSLNWVMEHLYLRTLTWCIIHLNQTASIVI